MAAIDDFTLPLLADGLSNGEVAGRLVLTRAWLV
jgi:hypothetical protein